MLTDLPLNWRTVLPKKDSMNHREQSTFLKKLPVVLVRHFAQVEVSGVCSRNRRTR